MNKKLKGITEKAKKGIVENRYRLIEGAVVGAASMVAVYVGYKTGIRVEANAVTDWLLKDIANGKTFQVIDAAGNVVTDKAEIERLICESCVEYVKAGKASK